MSKISYGVAESRGGRSYMEDSHAIRDEELPGLFCAEVYDGHSGSQVAITAAEVLTQFFLSHAPEQKQRETIGEWFNAGNLRKAYLAFDRYAVEHSIRGGCAAATLYLYDDRFLVANTGDVRIVAGDGGITVELTVDHKPDLPGEQSRIESIGGRIIVLDQPRVEGQLNMSRALGDPSLKPYVTAEPRISEGFIGRETDMILLASDGLWNVFTSEEALTHARMFPDPQSAAANLMAKAIELGSMDNITIVVLDMKEYVSPFQRARLEVTKITDHAVDLELA